MKKIQRFPNLFWIIVLPNILKIHPQVLSVRELHVCFKVLNTRYIFICKVMLTIKTVILPPCILSAVQKKGVQFYMCPYVKEVRIINVAASLLCHRETLANVIFV